MSFMQPEIYESDYYEVEYDHGSTAFIPLDVVDADYNGNLRDYVEGKIDEPDAPVTVKSGWVCRLQAPGYMDATDWSAFDTEREAIEHILETYGSCDRDSPPEDWERDLENRLEEIESKSGNEHS